jgi:hypothetical protein
VLHSLASTTTASRPGLFPGRLALRIAPNSLPNRYGHPQPSFQGFLSHRCPATHHFTHHAICCHRLLVLSLVSSNMGTISWEPYKALLRDFYALTGHLSSRNIVISTQSRLGHEILPGLGRESMKIGWIVAPGVSTVLRMIVRGSRCVIGPLFACCKQFPRASAALRTTSYLYVMYSGGWFSLPWRTAPPCGRSTLCQPAHPLFPHCGAGG